MSHAPRPCAALLDHGGVTSNMRWDVEDHEANARAQLAAAGPLARA